MTVNGECHTRLKQQIEAVQRCLDRFRQQLAALPDGQQAPAAEFLGDFSTCLEALNVAVEELQEQNRELAVHRQEAEEGHRRCRELFDLAPDSYLVTDSQGVIEDANRAAEVLFGKSGKQLLNKPLAVLLDRRDQRRYRQLLSRLQNEEIIRDVELRIDGQESGNPVVVNVTVSHCDQGKSGKLCWSLRDSGEFMQAQERLRQLQLELAHMARLSALGGMASGLAHELNQPLTAIVSYTQTAQQLLRSGAGQQEMLNEALDQVAAQGLRAGEIIRQIRDFARYKEFQRQPLDLNALILHILSLVEWQAERHGVSIKTELAEGMPRVKADAIQIQQVVVNLLNNAIEVLQDSPGERQITLRTTFQADDCQVETEVADTGPGISGETIEHIFNPFFTTKSRGMGIGLNISRSIIEAHGGRLWVTSTPGEGASFYFTLAVERP